VNRLVEDGFLTIVQPSTRDGQAHRYQLLVPKSFGVAPQIQKKGPQIPWGSSPNPSPSNHQEPSLEPAVEKFECVYCHMRIVVGRKHFCSAMRMEM
jgi:hypothetical protein